MVHAANADQAAFWNDQPGRNWVERQADLDRMLGEVTDRLLAVSAPEPGEAVLDVGCGAGASTFALARAVGAGGKRARARPLGAADRARRGAAARARPRQCLVRDRRRPGAGLCARALRPRRLALRRHVLRRPGGGLPQHRDRPACRGPDGLRRLGGPEDNPWFVLPQQAAVDRLGPAAPMPPEAPGPMAFRDIPRVLGLLEAAGLDRCRGEARGRRAAPSGRPRGGARPRGPHRPDPADAARQGRHGRGPGRDPRPAACRVRAVPKPRRDPGPGADQPVLGGATVRTASALTKVEAG